MSEVAEMKWAFPNVTVFNFNRKYTGFLCFLDMFCQRAVVRCHSVDPDLDPSLDLSLGPV